MEFEFRAVNAAEMDQFGELTAYAYGGAFGYGEDNLAKTATRPEWTLCAFDGPRLAASYATLPLTARANGKAVAMGGVTTVATAPEYRRRGLLRSITTRALEAQREAGQSVAALWASQAAIYQRYGYTAATAQISYQIDSVDLQLLTPADDSLRVSRGSVSELMDDIKSLYRTFIAERSLYLHRSSGLWQSNVLNDNNSKLPIRAAICRDETGGARGYVIYTLADGKVSHRARNQLLAVGDLVATDLAAYRALWVFLGKHDLVGSITWQRAPLDDPLPELLAEPRLLNTQAHEGLWLRLVDIAAALAARGYQCDGEVSFSVEADPLTPWNDGSYRLNVSNGSAEVARISTATEFTIDRKHLASAWCGRHRLSTLANWGLVTGDPAAIARADVLLATRYQPHCPDHF
jgi:predicted acetyltransferase